MGALTVVTFGEPLIAHDNLPCATSTRKALALGLYLAVTGQPHTRAQLIALFWPDADDPHGQVNLRQALRRLRQALGTDADAHVVSSGDLLRLDLGAGGSVDTALLQVATSQQALPADHATALGRYAGAFLADLTLDNAPDFMDWAAAQRAYWEGCYDLVAERETQRLLDAGQAADAEALGQTWVTRRPDCETAYRLLSTAQAISGDVAAARLTLTTAMRRWEEMGLSLAPETLTLRDRLHTLPPPSTAKRQLSLPFVGRDEAFAQLRQALDDAERGHCGVALIQGEAGIGKSRLVDTFAQWAQVHGSDIAIGHAYELSGRVPYHPFSELLRERLAREHAPDDLVDDSWLIELQRLAPDLHDRYPDLPLPANDATAGARLLEAIVQVGMALGRRRPLVWVIEDLHWADEATRDGLLYVLERWRTEQVPILVIATLRSEEFAGSATLTWWRDAVQRLGVMTTVLLQPWSAEVTQHAITSSLGESAGPDLCGWLFDQTQGNPLYLIHVLQALEEHGLVQWQGDKPRLESGIETASLSEWLPESLRGVLLRRVRRLDAEVRYVISAAAVVGSRFQEDVLASVAGVAEDALVAALETAEQALLIRADGPQYIFTHDKVAEAIYSVLALARRQVFHRRAFAALAQVPACPAAELARHAVAGGMRETAFTASVAAGDEAHAGFAIRDALAHYERAWRLLAELAPDLWRDVAIEREQGAASGLSSPFDEAAVRRRELRRPETVPSLDEYDHLLRRLARCYWYLARDSQQQVVLDLRRALAHVRGAEEVEAETLASLGFIALRGSPEVDDARLARAFEMNRDLSRLLSRTGEISDSSREAAAWWNLAQAVALTHHWELALHLTAQVHAEAGRLQAIDAMAAEEFAARSHYLLGHIALLQGRWETAASSLAASQDTYRRLALRDDARERPQPTGEYHFWAFGNPRCRQDYQAVEVDCLCTRALAQQMQGETSEALATARSALVLAEQIRSNAASALAAASLTLALVDCGHYEEALAVGRTARERAQTTHFTTQHRSLLSWVDAVQALGREEEALPLLQQIWLVGRSSTSYNPGDVLGTRLCQNRALAGDWAEAAVIAHDIAARRVAIDVPLFFADVYRYVEVEALLRAGAIDEAQTEVSRVDAYLEQHAGPTAQPRRIRLVYLRMRALLDRELGHHTTTITHLQEALDLATKMGLPGEEWQIAAELAASYIMLGDAQRAQEARTQSNAIIDDLAAHFTDLTQRDHFARAARSRRPALS
jgi:DNA-binding SARP family transcriptional activator